jgi:arsenate reductase (thioredoxin)
LLRTQAPAALLQAVPEGHLLPARQIEMRMLIQDLGTFGLRMARALFVCLHNAGRSQISEALFSRAAEGRHEARSAGTTPADHVHPEVVEVMAEVGLDLSGRTPRGLTSEDAEWADVVVTMGCGDECPYIPSKRYVDWDLPDPKGRPVDEVRAVRDEIAARVEALVAELDGD